MISNAFFFDYAFMRCLPSQPSRLNAIYPHYTRAKHNPPTQSSARPLGLVLPLLLLLPPLPARLRRRLDLAELALAVLAHPAVGQDLVHKRALPLLPRQAALRPRLHSAFDHGADLEAGREAVQVLFVEVRGLVGAGVSTGG